MALFEWRDEYSVSIARFDCDHQRLFALLNELNEAMADRRGRFVISGILQELADYARWHFAAEESAMRNAKFAGIDRHTTEHREFAAKVESFYAECDQRYSNVSIEVLYFLRDWLENHILRTDRQYAAALKGTTRP